MGPFSLRSPSRVKKKKRRRRNTRMLSSKFKLESIAEEGSKAIIDGVSGRNWRQNSSSASS